MSLLNKFFGIKKETQATPVTVMNETIDVDGYVHVARPVESHLLRQGPLPYAMNSNTPTTHQQQDNSSNKLYDEIPFQFSPAYSKIWSTGETVKRHSRKLKEIDWDSLCYDFKLEKSITQS